MDVTQTRSQWTALHLAYRRAQDAYQRARLLVFDLHPEGVPSEMELTESQRIALHRLKAAEADLEELRRQNSRRGWPVD